MAFAHRPLFFALALALPAAAQNASEDPAAAIIEGSVINIQNSRTIPRATVTLLRVKGAGNKSTRADGSGHFLFKNVEPGTYRMMAERQGFFSDERKREYQPLFDVAAGDHVRNIPVRLMPSAILSGEIVDEYNDPVQNVEVKLLAIQMRLGQMYLRDAGKATTDDRGQYRIAGLRPGRYYAVAEYKPNNATLEALKSAIAGKLLEGKQVNSASKNEVLHFDAPQESGERAYTYAPMFYSSTGDFQQAQAIRMNPGDELAANFLLISAPVVTIRGKITNGMTGLPPKGADVSAFWTRYMTGDGLPALASEDGTFEIRGVAPGTYTLRAHFTEDNQAYEGEQTIVVGNEGALESLGFAREICAHPVGSEFSRVCAARPLEIGIGDDG